MRIVVCFSKEREHFINNLFDFLPEMISYSLLQNVATTLFVPLGNKISFVRNIQFVLI